MYRAAITFASSDVSFEPEIKLKRTISNMSVQELYMRGTHLLLTAANYKPYLQWRDDFSSIVRSHDAPSSADTASSVTSSASENGNSPHYEGAFDHMSLSQAAAFTPQISTAVSPTHHSVAGSPAHNSGTDSAASSWASSPPHDPDADGFDDNEKYTGGTIFHESFEITCWCLKPHGSRNMIFCNECEKWLHFSCVKIRKDPNPDGDYMCPKCVARKETKRKSVRQRANKKRFDP
ncbi:PHD finger protein 13-like isoform X2 [Littorina saxatilis]|uniref:PHD finger protein 13-like isoform X2 n=1 Tax=Littorina saxatilis TaxID=31220 RepID=UPI0038B61DD9